MATGVSSPLEEFVRVQRRLKETTESRNRLIGRLEEVNRSLKESLESLGVDQSGLEKLRKDLDAESNELSQAWAAWETRWGNKLKGI